MKYDIAIYSSEEGFAVCVPSLPGCWSQGATQQEAIENISVAIREYLEDVPPRGESTAILSLPSGDPTVSEPVEVREIDVTD